MRRNGSDGGGLRVDLQRVDLSARIRKRRLGAPRRSGLGSSGNGSGSDLRSLSWISGLCGAGGRVLGGLTLEIGSVE